MSANLYDDAIEELEPAQEQAKPRSLFDEASSVLDEQQNIGLRRAVKASGDTTPDQAAEARRLALRYGIPPEVAARNLDTYKQKAKLDDVEKAGRENPALGAWLQNPHNGAVAIDDLPALTGFARVLDVGKHIVGGVGAGLAEGIAGAWETIRAAAETTETLASGSAPAEGVRRGAYPSPKVLATFATDAAAIWQHLAAKVRGSAEDRGFLERAAYSGIESFGQMVPGLVLSGITGTPAPMLTAAGVMAGGQAYGQARTQGVSVPTSLQFMQFQGAVEVATSSPGISLAI